MKMVNIHLNKKNSAAAVLVLLAFLIGGGVMFIMYKPYRDIPPISTDDRPGVISQVRTNDPVIALTFDIGWGSAPSEEILDVLRRHKIRATFFMPGSLTDEYARFLHRLAGEGHEIASHGYEHLPLTKCNRAQVADQIRSAKIKLRGETGFTPRLFRTPDGDYNSIVVAEAAKQGNSVVLWSIDSLDARNIDVAAIVSQVLTRAHPGAIVRFQGEETSGRTVEALPGVIDGLKALGYRIVPAGELLRPPGGGAGKTQAEDGAKRGSR